MKKIVLAFLISTNLFAQTDDCKCDYIKDYYQLVYHAEISYLQNEFDTAYDLLKQAEQNCELLNQPGIFEIELLCELSLKKGKHKEVLHYVELALTKGVQISNFENNPEYEGITELEGWAALKERAQQIYYDWYGGLHLELRHELLIMDEEDQRVRQGKSHYDDEMREVDDSHETRFKEILSEYGYPNEQVIGNYNIDGKLLRIETFACFHVKDIDYFKPLYLEYVRCGKAPADLYASLIESHDRRRGMFTYGIYQNITPEYIDDFENLDERRINAGLRPYEMEKLNQKLIQEKIQKLIEMSKN
jgi:hypothetical protein